MSPDRIYFLPDIPVADPVHTRLLEDTPFMLRPQSWERRRTGDDTNPKEDPPLGSTRVNVLRRGESRANEVASDQLPGPFDRIYYRASSAIATFRSGAVNHANGFFVESNGRTVLVTAHHVAADTSGSTNPRNTVVTLPNGREVRPTRIERDAAHDLAVMHFSPGDLEGVTPVSLASTDAARGESVYVFGYRGHQRVMMEGTNLATGDRWAGGVSVGDLDLHGGQSGSALLNARGEAIGIALTNEHPASAFAHRQDIYNLVNRR